MNKSLRKIILLTATVVLAVVCFAFSAGAEAWGDYNYIVLNDGTVSITGYNGDAVNLVIPSTVNGKKVTRIGERAFYSLDSLKSVEIPNSVTSVGKKAFGFSNYIETVKIGSGVSEIEETAFGYCYSLKKIIVDESNKHFSSSSDGVLFDKNKTRLVQYNINSDRTSYTVPSSVTSIGSYAFMDADKLETITVTKSVTEIGVYSFWHCKYLEKVIINGKIKEISDNAFYGCQNLEAVNVSSCEAIGNSAFEDCTSLKSFVIPQGVKEIKNSAFANCSSLSKVTIPDTVTYIGNYAFANCSSLSDVEIPAKVTYIGYAAFNNAGITAVTIPEGVTSIYFNTFSNTKLKNVYIHKNITELADSAFLNCEKLENVNVSSENSNYKSVNGIVYDKNMTKLIVFPKNSPVTDFNIPEGVEETYYFYSNNIKSLTIPSSLTAINACDGDRLKEIKVNAGNPKYCAVDGVLFSKDKTELIKYPAAKTEAEYTVPKGVKIIAGSAFSGCNNLKNVIVSDGVERINVAFSYCLNMQNIIIPESVTYFDCENFYCGTNGLVIKNIYYRGSKEEWDAIKKHSYYTGVVFPTATIHYNYTGDHFHNDNTTSTTKATLTKNGKTVTKCSVCGNVSGSTTIYSPKTITLSKTEYTYNGKAKTPSVTVKDSKGNTLKKDTDYTVKYESGRKNPGKYTVTVTFKGKYSGTKKLYFTIAPKVTDKVTVTQSTDAIRLTWDKVTGATGYRVYQYNSKTKKYEKIKTLKGTTLRIEKLKSGTTYKFKVKAYTKDGDTIWGKATDVITAATKPATPKITKLTTSKAKASLTWSNVSGESGYEVYASTKKDSGYKKVVTAKANVVKGSKSKLTSGKKYYFKVRAYKTVDGKKVYSAWSAVKSIKIK